MAWFRLDDQGAFHAKVLTAGNEAYGAWCRAGQWSSLHGTNGRIPRATAFTIAKPHVWTKLVDSGLVDPSNDGAFQMHDFLDWNPSADQVQSKRELVSEKRREAGRIGGKRSAASRRRDGRPSSKPPITLLPPPQQTSKQLLEQNEAPIPIPIPIPEKKEDPPISPKASTGADDGSACGVPESEWLQFGNLFVAAYERAARDARGNPRWALTKKHSLKHLLKTCCLGSERSDIEGWIVRQVAALDRFVRELPESDQRFWPDIDPTAMQRWFNRPGRPSHQPRSPIDAPQDDQRPPTPEQKATLDLAIRDLLADDLPTRRQASAAIDDVRTPEELAAIEAQRIAALEWVRSRGSP